MPPNREPHVPLGVVLRPIRVQPITRASFNADLSSERQCFQTVVVVEFFFALRVVSCVFARSLDLDCHHEDVRAERNDGIGEKVGTLFERGTASTSPDCQKPRVTQAGGAFEADALANAICASCHSTSALLWLRERHGPLIDVSLVIIEVCQFYRIAMQVSCEFPAYREWR